MTFLPIGKAVSMHRLARVPLRSSRKPLRAQRRVAVTADPLELIVRGHERTVMFACRRCRTCYSTSTLIGPDPDRIAYAREQALRCCDGRCRTCNAPVQRFYTSCSDCTEKRRKRERRAWAYRAKPVPYDGGWIYSDHVQGYGDGYFDSLDGLAEYIADNASEGLAMPAWVHPCREIHPSIDLASIFESMDDDFGVDDQYPSQDLHTKDLEEAVAALNEEAKSITAYHVMFSRVIILDADAFNGEFGTDLDRRPITSFSAREPTIDPMPYVKWLRMISEAQAEALQDKAESEA